MKMNKGLIITLILAFAIVAAPAFAQIGVGVGVGSQTKVGVGGQGAGAGVGAGAGARAGGITAGVRTNGDVHTKTPEARTQAKPNLDIVSRIQSNPEMAARVETMLPS